jgi:hypothetical protein
MTVCVIAGSAVRTPTLAELEWAAEALADRQARVVRHRDAKPQNRGGQLIGTTDAVVSGWLRARQLVAVEAWPSGDDAASMRNRAMLSGDRPGVLIPSEPASFMIRFEADDDTRNCTSAALQRGLHVHWIHERAEPRIWNRHHGEPPGPWVYVGGNKKDPSRASPLANPWADQVPEGKARAPEAVRVLDMYKQWLWARINRKSTWYSPAIIELILSFTPEHYLVCSCWPAHCHAEIIVLAWRWLMKEHHASTHRG